LLTSDLYLFLFSFLFARILPHGCIFCVLYKLHERLKCELSHLKRSERYLR
jgi:hypothetical protein